MIISDKSVFIHMHKCGGQFVNELLLEFVPSAREVGYHFPLSHLPEGKGDLPVIAFIRNPWDWYVSWYFFNESHPTRNPIFRIMSEDGKLGFKETIERLVNLGLNEPHYLELKQRLIDSLPETISANRGSGITKADISTYQDRDTGYLSWLFDRMLRTKSSPPSIMVGRVEHLRQDLHKFLIASGETVGPKFEQAIYNRPTSNTSSRGDYRSYYDSGLSGLVARKECELVETFGYNYQ